MRDIISTKSIFLDLDVPNKKDAIQQLAQNAAQVTGKDPLAIFDVLWAREKLGTTGVGGGIAIPHARWQGIEQVQGFFARMAKPIAFDAVDDKPVDLVFLLLAPETAGADHLHALATVSRVLRDRVLCELLRKAKDEQAIYQLLVQNETAEAA